MHIAKDEIPAKIDSPGAVARQQSAFGSAKGYDEFAAEYFTLEAGTDITQLLEGLEDDLCQSPHWGYVLDGELTVTYADGSDEVDKGGELFYWPPGHTVRAEADTDFVIFSPQYEHEAVLDHIKRKMNEGA